MTIRRSQDNLVNTSIITEISENPFGTDYYEDGSLFNGFFPYLSNHVEKYRMQEDNEISSTFGG